MNAHGRWASQSQINNSPVPGDVDGLEVWGPEPGFTADSDKYSLGPDSNSLGALPNAPNDAVSVWNLSGTEYILHSRIVQAVTTALGALPTSISALDIDLDALMVREIVNDIDVFERGLNTTDQIIFSIRQIVDPNAADGSGYYATGSEIFVLDAPFVTGAPGAVSFLNHGGHLWDKNYALANMVWLSDVLIGDVLVDVRVQLDVNAIEAIADAVVVPEISSAAFCLAAIMIVGGLQLRRRRVRRSTTARLSC